MSAPVRVVRNDWSAVEVPDLGGWRPERTVSVVIPAYQCQASLELALAALAHQTYPAHLLEVVVVDDGSQPPLELPKIRPQHCRLVAADGGRGRAHALATGVRHSDGEIIHWLDADMVTDPWHVEAQARWHHRVPYAVTLGWKRFVDVAPEQWPTPDEVADAYASGDVQRLFADTPGRSHDYVEELVRRTGDLRDGDHLAFLAHVGATAALRRELYEAAGGLDTSLRLGEDTEFGYRLAQAGAVFVPEQDARSWHLGPTHMMRHEAALQRYNRPHLAERMPLPRYLRDHGGTGAVPLVTVVVEVEGQPLERVRAAVDPVLRGAEPDVRVLLVGPWDTLGEPPRQVLADPRLDLRLVRASYSADPRVRLVDRAPQTAFPSPYLLELPATRAMAKEGVRRLVEHAERQRLGLVRVSRGLALWRTAAVSRARWVRRDGEALADVVAAVHGAGELPPETVGLVDLTRFSAEDLAAGVPAAAARPGRWLPGSVEVAGIRSLARAAWVVARLAVIRARHRWRRRFGRTRKT
jgi:GT2 family glycosyltransferase